MCRYEDVLGGNVTVPIRDTYMDLFSLGGAFIMFNLVVFLDVVDIMRDACHWFYLWHVVSSGEPDVMRRGKWAMIMA